MAALLAKKAELEALLKVRQLPPANGVQIFARCSVSDGRLRPQAKQARAAEDAPIANSQSSIQAATELTADVKVRRSSLAFCCRGKSPLVHLTPVLKQGEQVVKQPSVPASTPPTSTSYAPCIFGGTPSLKVDMIVPVHQARQHWMFKLQ
jgi:hypothetical protein